MEIVDIVRGLSIPLDDLAAALQSLKGGAIPNHPTSGQVDPKSAKPKIISDKTIISENTEKEQEDKSE